MSPTQPKRIEVGQAEAGKRLDLVLGERLGLSRAQVKRLLDQGAVTVDGRGVGRAGKGDPLSGGQRVVVFPFDREEDQRPIPQPELPLRELASGDGWIIVDKPAGVPVHPLFAEETGTVLNAVAARHPQVFGVGEAGLRSGVVHRLDVGTSGTLLFALDQPTWQRFRENFRGHRVTKIYQALVRGQVHVGDAITLPLEVAQHHPAKVRVTGGEGRMCDLAYRPLEIFDDATLLEVNLGTGFLHQIRVSLAYLGHPVLGDTHYAPEAPHVNAGPHTPGSTLPGATPAPESAPPGRGGIAPPPIRPMLHACSLRCREAAATCDPPDDFQDVLRRLRTAMRQA